MLPWYGAVGLGGAVGAIMRVALISVLPRYVLTIPLQVLFINSVGSFCMGFVMRISPLSASTRYFFISGLLGGFTTFASYSRDFAQLCFTSDYKRAALYAAAHFFITPLCLIIGIYAASMSR